MLSYRRASDSSAPSCDRYVSLFCMMLFGITLAVTIGFLLESLSVPLLDMHGFRQTQTAISSFWMRQEGTIIPYQTPVFGYPWKIPYEFPLYQMMASAVSSLGIPLDLSGRFVSYLFFVLLLLPVYKVFRVFRIEMCLFYIFASLYLSSPAYLFWGRAFLIETTALFFCLTGALFIIVYCEQKNILQLFLAVLFLTVGALVKGTTYPQCVLFAFGAAVYLLYRDRSLATRERLGFLLKISVGCILPVLVGIAWVAYCDYVKSATVMSSIHTSSSLKHWYSIDLNFFLQHIELLHTRILPEIIGWPWMAYLCLPLSFFLGMDVGCIVFFLFLCFFSPMVIFTHVHIVHNYYQVSNGVFLIFAVAFFVYSLRKTKIKQLVPFLLVLCVGLNYLSFYNHFYKSFLNTKRTGDKNNVIKISSMIDKTTNIKDVVFIFGMDWSPEVPYYSQRKSVMFPFWLPHDILMSSVQNYTALRGDAPIGAVLVCPSGDRKNSFYYDAVAILLKKMSPGSQQETAAGCTLYSRFRN